MITVIVSYKLGDTVVDIRYKFDDIEAALEVINSIALYSETRIIEFRIYSDKGDKING